MTLTRTKTPERVAAACAMLAGGSRLSVVARAFGISWSTAKQWTDPERYARHKSTSLQWLKDNPARVNELARERRLVMTDAQRDRLAVYQRQRYATNPSVKAKLNELAAKYRLQAQYSIGNKLRLGVLGWSNRLAQMFAALMLSVTGRTREEFTKDFIGEGVFDHIVPLAAFDLTNPEHIVRANHPSNLRLVTAKVNNRKHAKHDCADVMSLQWSNNPDAIVQAQSFISRQLRLLEASS